jgi:hypothetical protein
MPKLSQQSKVEYLIKPRVSRLVDERIRISQQLEELEKLRDEINGQLLEETIRAGGSFESDDWKVTKVDSENRRINKDLLLELGVKPSIIAKATSIAKYAYAKVTVKKR